MVWAIGAAPGLVDGRDQPLGVVVHHAREPTVVEAAVEQRDLPQGRRHVAVESLQTDAGDEHLAEDELGHGVHRQAARLALPRVADEDGVQHLLVAEDRRRRQFGDAVGEELEDVLVLTEGEVAQREAGREHVEVRVEGARVDAVGGERAFEAPQGLLHASQRRARHVQLDALGDYVVEQPAEEVLDAEREAERVEPRLAVVAVDRRDAGGDVPLLVDVLGGGGRRRAEDDGLECLEDRQAGVQQCVTRPPTRTGLPASKGGLEPVPDPRVELEVAGERHADVVGGE